MKDGLRKDLSVNVFGKDFALKNGKMRVQTILDDMGRIYYSDNDEQIEFKGIELKISDTKSAYINITLCNDGRLVNPETFCIKNVIEEENKETTTYTYHPGTDDEYVNVNVKELTETVEFESLESFLKDSHQIKSKKKDLFNGSTEIRNIIESNNSLDETIVKSITVDNVEKELSLHTTSNAKRTISTNDTINKVADTGRLIDVKNVTVTISNSNKVKVKKIVETKNFENFTFLEDSNRESSYDIITNKETFDQEDNLIKSKTVTYTAKKVYDDNKVLLKETIFDKNGKEINDNTFYPKYVYGMDIDICKSNNEVTYGSFHKEYLDKDANKYDASGNFIINDNEIKIGELNIIDGPFKYYSDGESDVSELVIFHDNADTIKYTIQKSSDNALYSCEHNVSGTIDTVTIESDNSDIADYFYSTVAARYTKDIERVKKDIAKVAKSIKLKELLGIEQ